MVQAGLQLLSSAILFLPYLHAFLCSGLAFLWTPFPVTSLNLSHIQTKQAGDDVNLPHVLKRMGKSSKHQPLPLGPARIILE